MAQLAIKNLSKLSPFPGGPRNLPTKFHLYLILVNSVVGFQSSVPVSLRNILSVFKRGIIGEDFIFAPPFKIFVFQFSFYLPKCSWTRNLYSDHLIARHARNSEIKHFTIHQIREITKWSFRALNWTIAIIVYIESVVEELTARGPSTGLQTGGPTKV